MASVFYKMNAEVNEKIKLFNIEYFIAKEELPFTMFLKLIQLHQINGLDLGTTCQNDNGCRTFIEAISQEMKGELAEKMRTV